MGIGHTALSVIGGVGFTLILFLGITHFQNTTPAVAPLEFDDLRTVAIPLEPPPSRVVHPERAEPAITSVTGFDAAPSDSPVKIAIVPPDLAALFPTTAAPAAVIPVGQLYSDFKPGVYLGGYGQHIFQVSEVDQVPRVLHTVMPAVSASMIVKGSAHVSVIVVVDANGVVSRATLAQTCGNPVLDEIMLQNIKEWTFSPAVKRGKPVKCLIQQGYRIQLPRASMFTTD